LKALENLKIVINRWETNSVLYF